MSSQALKLNPSLKNDVVETLQENKRILVVDDEASIAEGIKMILAPSGNVIPLRRSSRQSVQGAEANYNEDSFEVVVCNTPEQALEQVRKSVQEERPFAVGFFDVLLGAQIDGIELVRKVFEIDPDLFAVFVTAYQDRTVDAIRDHIGSEKSDRWDYINKPFTEGEIRQKARNFVSLWNLRANKRWHEERLAEAHKLLFENERMNTVAAVGRSVAHEFGNLMMQIVGHAEIALLKNDPQRMKEALDTILKASETANEILKRFKKVSNGSDSGTEMKLLNLVKPIDEAIELMKFQFRKSEVEIEKVKFDQALIEAHHHSLVQVFMNLFINSTHAMSKGGKIFLSMQKISPQEVEIIIRDQGSGIPEELLEKVVQPMFTTKGEKGTGLGLAICKEIVEIEHRGYFQLRNSSEGGLEVVIRLPTRQEREA